MGPLIDEKAANEVLSFVKDAVDKGAQVLAGQGQSARHLGGGGRLRRRLVEPLHLEIGRNRAVRMIMDHADHQAPAVGLQAQLVQRSNQWNCQN